MTGIHWAARRGHLQITELLLKYNSDINALDISGRTPLYLSLIN